MNLSLPLVAAAALLASGCISINTARRNPPESSPEVMPVPSYLAPADAAVFAEINAAASLNFDNSKVEALNAIAGRPHLAPVAQAHLAKAAYRKLNFENSKVAVLTTLIKNPAFSDEARQAIATHINHLSFEHSKQTVLQLLNERQTAPQQQN